jgi:hypothetical protein
MPQISACKQIDLATIVQVQNYKILLDGEYECVPARGF